MDDPVGAYVPHGHVLRTLDGTGPLRGLTIAVKDLFDWKGVPTGAGNPAWLASHPVPDHDAAVLTTLLGAGAVLHGKTITDELAYSIHGDNVHYGTPRNVQAPGRVPGGSSSGSAAAVAAGLVDAALGTDTGGSIRVPAAYCGLFGLRTTHDAVDRAGLVPLAPTFDTVGWLSRTPGPLLNLAEVLLPNQSSDRAWNHVFWLEEADQLTDIPTRQALTRARQELVLPLTDVTEEALPAGGLETLRQRYVTVQAFEAWQCHGEWIASQHPAFGPAIAQRFLAASQVTEAAAEAAREAMHRFRSALRTRLGASGVLVVPAAAGPAPLLDAPAAEVDEIRTRTMRLTCLAGLAGLPQVTVPFRGPDHLPRGVGLVGPAGSDRALIALGARLAGSLSWS